MTLDVFLRVFLDEVYVLIVGRWVKQIILSNLGGLHPIGRRLEWNKKRLFCQQMAIALATLALPESLTCWPTVQTVVL